MTPADTGRLRLRPVGRGDAADLCEALQDWEVVRWLSRVPWPYSRADADRFAGEVEAGRIPAFALHDARGLAGVIGIDPTLGYWLRRDRWGLGYATEAGRAVLAWHFAQAGAAAVDASYFVGNAASARVLGKLGFEPAGPVRIASLPLGREVDALRLRLTPARWQALAAEGVSPRP